MAAVASAGLVTSSFTASRLSFSPTARATLPGLRPVATTAWPAARAALAMSMPIPRPAPVMNQTFCPVLASFCSVMFCLSWVRCSGARGGAQIRDGRGAGGGFRRGRCRPAGKERQRVFGCGPRLRREGVQGLSLIAGTVERLELQRHIPGDRVVEALGSRGVDPYVMAGPQCGEVPAACGQFADQLVQCAVMGIPSRFRSEHGHRGGGDCRPIGVEVPGTRIEERYRAWFG